MSHTIAKSYIAQFLPENPVIVEAGAHIGRDTITMKKQWPQAVIHVFEPVLDLFAQLKNNTAHVPNIFYYPYALAAYTGTAILHKSSGRSTATSSLLEPYLYKQEHPDTHFDTITVPTITLDAWKQYYAITSADFLWLDMQGSELAVLQHATDLLRTVQAIYTEATTTERYKHNPLYPELRAFLEQQGFAVQQEAFNAHGWGNVLFVR